MGQSGNRGSFKTWEQPRNRDGTFGHKNKPTQMRAAAAKRDPIELNKSSGNRETSDLFTAAKLFHYHPSNVHISSNQVYVQPKEAGDDARNFGKPKGLYLGISDAGSVDSWMDFCRSENFLWEPGGKFGWRTECAVDWERIVAVRTPYDVPNQFRVPSSYCETDCSFPPVTFSTAHCEQYHWIPDWQGWGDAEGWAGVVFPNYPKGDENYLGDYSNCLWWSVIDVPSVCVWNMNAVKVGNRTEAPR